MDMLTIFIIIIACVVLCLIAYFVGKHRALLPIALSVIAIVFIATSAKCFIDLNNYYSASDGVFGYLSGMVPNNQASITIKDNIKISLNNIVLVQETNTDSFSAQIYLNDVVELQKDKAYTVAVNGEPSSKVDYSTGNDSFVRAEYVYQFLGNDLSVLCTDTLTFNFAFFDKGTEVKITTDGGQTAVDYWNKFFSRNDFDVEIKATEYISDSELTYGTGDYSNYHTITYFVDETEYLSQIVNENDKVTLINAPDKEGYIFDYWADAEGNRVEMNSKFSEDIVLTAVYQKSNRTVLFSGEKEISCESISTPYSDKIVADLSSYFDFDMTGLTLEVTFDFGIYSPTGEATGSPGKITLKTGESYEIDSYSYGVWGTLTLNSSAELVITLNGSFKVIACNYTISEIVSIL